MRHINYSSPVTLLKGSMAVLLSFGAAIIGPVAVHADDAYTMAPPVDYQSSTSNTNDVFQWTEIPQNQRVPLTRAVFDKSGYQLYDTQGETILVPFTNNNLYVMKFAVSPDGSTYFINEGSTPILYLPRDGFLVNQATDGARWYPFTDGFAPSTPVFLGCARNWDDFCDIGWYPGMAFYGGFWYGGPHFRFDALIPCDGFFISIGINNFRDWDSYRFYAHRHPDFDRIGFADHDWHGWDGHRDHFVTFRGVDNDHHGFGSHDGFSNRVFRGGAGFFGGSHDNGNFDHGHDGSFRGGNVDSNRGHDGGFQGGSNDLNRAHDNGFHGMSNVPVMPHNEDFHGGSVNSGRTWNNHDEGGAPGFRGVTTHTQSWNNNAGQNVNSSNNAQTQDHGFSGVWHNGGIMHTSNNPPQAPNLGGSDNHSSHNWGDNGSHSSGGQDHGGWHR